MPSWPRSLAAVVPLLPYLASTWLVWWLQRLVVREDCWNEVAPGLYLGRRAWVHELPAGVDLVVDLTAEFREPVAVRAGRAYRCVPTLDAPSPPVEVLRSLAAEIAAWPGKAYLHGAAGHGQSAVVAASVMITRGLASTVEEAEAALRRARPGVVMRHGQRLRSPRLSARPPAADGIGSTGLRILTDRYES